VTKALRTGGGAEKIAVDETFLTSHEIFMNFEEAVKLLLVTADYEPRNDGNFSRWVTRRGQHDEFLPFLSM
jgi:hypothetical protein